MSAWLKALKALTEKSPDDDELDLVTKEASNSTSDRAMALMNASLVDAALQTLIKGHLVPMSKEELASLFERDGPLSSFSKLIRVSFAFGMINDEMKRNLNIVRELRNTFAHSRIFITFETPAIATACGLLTQWYTEYKDVPHDKDHPRTKYLGASSRLISVLGRANFAHRTGKLVEFPLRFGK
ncbi:MAG: hypothetical protein ACJ8IR_08220 [Alphaproteobacteria bacterium]|jgi:hypothetical protein